MATKTTRGELATLAKQLPSGDEQIWCEAAGSGPAGQVVYADSEMLSRCRDGVSSPNTGESKQESNDEAVQGQPGSTVATDADPGKGKKPTKRPRPRST